MVFLPGENIEKTVLTVYITLVFQQKWSNRKAADL
jgi:hypothetical protein